MIKRRQNKFLLFFLFFSIYHLFSDPLYDASVLEKEGKGVEALKIYTQWLSDNRTDLRFLDILTKTAMLSEDVDKAISIYLNFVTNSEGSIRKNIYEQIGLLYELSFRNSYAADYYRMAAISVDPPDPILLLRSMKLYYQSGQIPDDREIDSLLMKDLDSDSYVDALLFKAELLIYRGEWNTAEDVLLQSSYSNLYPVIQFTLWEIYMRTDNRKEAARIFDFMKETYPDSIELAIMTDHVNKIPRISDFFLSTGYRESINIQQTVVSETPVYIQAGVFSKESNAVDLSESIEEAGFDSFIVRNGRNYRVLVKGGTSLLQSLKEKGFDGFITEYP
ncbi:MAG: SPOR domain-containing protein [Spirochaetales bacterium]|nr:SPOR domain-containing protein [Spirochaetales bacterium]